jgi:hypothetical protein
MDPLAMGAPACHPECFPVRFRSYLSADLVKWAYPAALER